MKRTKADVIRRLLADGLTVAEIAAATGASRNYVCQVRYHLRHPEARAAWMRAHRARDPKRAAIIAARARKRRKQRERERERLVRRLERELERARRRARRRPLIAGPRHWYR